MILYLKGAAVDSQHPTLSSPMVPSLEEAPPGPGFPWVEDLKHVQGEDPHKCQDESFLYMHEYTYIYTYIYALCYRSVAAHIGARILKAR